MADPSEPKPNEIDADNLSRLLEIGADPKARQLEASGRPLPINSRRRIHFSVRFNRGLLDRRLLCFDAAKRDAAKPAKCRQQLRSRSLMSILGGEVTIPRHA